MKCLLTLLTLLLAALPSTAGGRVLDEEAPGIDGAAQAIFAEGGAAYRRGDYVRATELWTSLFEHDLSEREESRVAFDLGNAAWRSGNELEAVGWYTRSVRVNPRNRDAWENLELARGKLELGPADHGDLRATVERLLESLRPRGVRTTMLIVLGLLAIALCGEALRGGLLWRFASIFFAALLVFVSIPWAYGVLRSGGDPMLVVQATPVSLRSEPRGTLGPIAQLDPGVEAQRVDELGDWVRLRTEDGTLGWTPADALFAVGSGGGRRER